MFKKWRKPITMFLLCSVLLHLGLWLWLSLVKPQPTKPLSEAVEVSFVEPLSPPPTKTLEPELKTEKQQIVEQDQRLNDEIDPNARFLSAFNQVVKRQTRAAQNGQFKNSQQKKRLSLSDLKPTFEPGAKKRQPSPNEEILAEGSQTDDYLKNIEVGMQTMLSTREFLYYSYYQRIKEKIRQHWEPMVREKVKVVFRQGRSIASTKDHITQIVITLDNIGELVRVEVLTPSGLQALDEAAVEAFRAAAPFPNPPKGLIEGDGRIRIRWDFVLEAALQKRAPKVNDIAQGRSDENSLTGRL